MIDDRTINLNLPKPNANNTLEEDVVRLRDALDGADTAIAARQLTSQKGQANGYASLDGTGKVPAAQLPSYVDDVLEFATLANFPGTGESGKLYVSLNNNKTYRWSGSAYIEIAGSPGSTDVVTEGSTNLYFTAARVLSTVIAGLSTATNAAINAADSVLVALGKLQAQINDRLSLAGGTMTGPITFAGAQTFPSSLATLTGTQTLTNKTISGGVHSGVMDISASHRSSIVAVAALAIDCSLGNFFTKTISANSTFTFSNVPAGRAYSLTLELTHTSGSVTWPPSVSWAGDATPALTAGKTHLFMFLTDDGGTRWRGSALTDFTN
jgi:hypothetical protein